MKQCCRNRTPCVIALLGGTHKHTHTHSAFARNWQKQQAKSCNNAKQTTLQVSGLLIWIKLHLLEVNVGFDKETKVIQVANLLQDKGLASMTHVSLQLCMQTFIICVNISSLFFLDTWNTSTESVNAHIAVSNDMFALSNLVDHLEIMCTCVLCCVWFLAIPACRCCSHLMKLAHICVSWMSGDNAEEVSANIN
jgi:hypothetical protein